MTETNIFLIKEAGLDEKDAFASVTLNPTLRWLKFILTDDQPNANKQRIPQEEFDNLIKSGINMPIKMAAGDIADGHENSFPVGVITHLKKVANKIEGLAALWSKERPEDIDLIINEFESGSPPQISWEVPYMEEVLRENGVKDLIGTILRAATLVRRPAFEGRTPVIAVAAKEVIEVTEPTETDSSMEENNTMEELDVLKSQLQEAQDRIKELEGQLQEKDEGFAAVEEELTSLREFKAQIEKEDAEAEQLASVRAKFAEAGIEKPDEYYIENRERFLSMTMEAVEFMVQEMTAFAKLAEASLEDDDSEGDGDGGDKEGEGLPAVVNTDDASDLDNPAEVGRQLRLLKEKK